MTSPRRELQWKRDWSHVAFVTSARMPAPGSPGSQKAPRSAPDLVAEVGSPEPIHPA